jgi:hypothetical protein
MQRKDWGKRTPGRRYGIAEKLTIWSQLHGKSERGGRYRRGRKRNDGQVSTGRHDIVNRGVGQSTGRHRSYRSVQGRKLSREAS